MLKPDTNWKGTEKNQQSSHWIILACRWHSFCTREVKLSHLLLTETKNHLLDMFTKGSNSMTNGCARAQPGECFLSSLIVMHLQRKSITQAQVCWKLVCLLTFPLEFASSVSLTGTWAIISHLIPTLYSNLLKWFMSCQMAGMKRIPEKEGRRSCSCLAVRD